MNFTDSKNELAQSLLNDEVSLVELQAKLDSFRNLLLVELNQDKKIPCNHNAILDLLKVPEAEYETFRSDLQILFTTERHHWLLENYEFPQNIQLHLANVEGHPWYGQWFIEIPFCVGNRYEI